MVVLGVKGLLITRAFNVGLARIINVLIINVEGLHCHCRGALSIALSPCMPVHILCLTRLTGKLPAELRDPVWDRLRALWPRGTR